MTEHRPKRYLLAYDRATRVYAVIDQTTGEVVHQAADMDAARSWRDTANATEDRNRAYLEALNRASGRPQ